MAKDPVALLGVGEGALKQGHWQAAQSAFRAVLALGESPEASFGMATAVWWLGDMSGTVAHLEQAYAGFRQRPEPTYAAAAALRLAFHQSLHLGNSAAAAGWLGRATRLIEDHELEALRGELLLTRACVTVDPQVAAELAAQALELGRAQRDPDLELCALGQLGASLVEQGQIAKGIALLDEAMAACLGGEPRNIETVAFTSCITMVSCARCADFERASQWVRATERFAERHGSPFHNAECRTIHSDVLLARGDWPGAEKALRAAIEISQGSMPMQHAEALAALANLRLLQGRVEEAERLLVDLDVPRRSTPVLARLHLFRGRPKLALATAQRRLDSIGTRCLESGPLLELLGEAEIALAQAKNAAEWGGRLAELGEALGCPVLCARGERLRGRALVRDGEPRARYPLDQALAIFTRLGMPYETARTRMLLAESLISIEPELAGEEARSALSTFQSLGAACDADASAAFLRQLGSKASRPRRAGSGSAGLAALTKREQEVLALLGEGLSNPEIAGRLYVSRKTVEHHVAHILEKLGLRNRSEAAAEALRRSGAAS